MDFNFEEFIRTRGKKFEPDPQTAIDAARYHLSVGDTATAIQHALQSFIMSHAGFESYQVMGEILEKIGTKSQVLSVTEATFEKFPNRYESYFGYGVSLMNNNKRDAAIDILRKGFLRFANYENVNFGFLTMLWDLDDIEFAARHSHRMLAVKQTPTDQKLVLLNHIIKSQQLNRIALRYAVAVASPTTPVHAVAMAEALLRAQLPTEALDVIARSDDRQDDQDVKTMLSLLRVQALLMLLELDEAFTALQGINLNKIGRKDQRAEYFRLAANAYRLRKHPKQARAFYERAMTAGDQSFLTRYEYIHVLEALGLREVSTSVAQNMLCGDQHQFLIEQFLAQSSGQVPRGAADQSIKILSAGLISCEALQTSSPARIKKALLRVLKSGTLTRCENVHAMYMMGRLCLSNGDIQDAMACWQTANSVLNVTASAPFTDNTMSILRDVPLSDQSFAQDDHDFPLYFCVGLPGTAYDQLMQTCQTVPQFDLQSRSQNCQAILHDLVRDGALTRNMLEGKAHIPNEIIAQIRTRFFQILRRDHLRGDMLVEGLGHNLQFARVLAQVFPRATFVLPKNSVKNDIIALYARPKYHVQGCVFEMSDVVAHVQEFHQGLDHLRVAFPERFIDLAQDQTPSPDQEFTSALLPIQSETQADEDILLDQLLDNMKLQIRVDDLMPFYGSEVAYAFSDT
jgi:tetratricopeptide (TPR) repeat protein